MEPLTCVRALRDNHFCAGSDKGYLHFYKCENKRYEHIRQWTSLEIKFNKITSIATHEAGKNEVWVAVAAKSLNIVCINVWSQVYNKEKS